MAENEFQDINEMRQSIHAGLNPEDVVWRGEDGSRATDVDRGQFTLYGEEQVAAFNTMLADRQKVTSEQPKVAEEKTDDFFEGYKINQVNAWKKFYATEEDMLVEAKTLSEKTGIPENIILTNDETIQQVRAIQKAQEKNLDMEQVFKENPSLAALAKDGNDTLAAIAMNHLPEVKEQKALIDTIKDQWRVAEIQNELNMMGRAEMDGGKGIDFGRVKALQEELLKLKAPSFSDDPLGAVIGGVVGQLPQMYRSGLKAIERGTQMGTAGAMLGGATAGAASLGVAAPAGAITGAGVGFAAGSRAGYYEGSYNEMVGSNYLDLRAERNADGTFKYSKDQARVIAATQAAVSAGIETFTFGRVTEVLGNAKGVFASQVKDIIKNAATKEAGYYALWDWTKNVAKVTWEESREEGLQSISDDLIRNAGDLIFGKNISNSARDIFNNAVENFIEAVPASMGFGIIGAGSAMSSALVRKAARALQLDNQTKFNETKTGKGIELINSLKQSLANSKLFKSDKETATEVLKNNLAGSGFENVYIDSAELRQNGQTELLGKVVDALDISDEKKQAILDGREEINSAIPTETFMQVAVETDEKLNEYISFDANAFSFAKNKRYAETIKKEIDALKNVDLKEQKEIESIILDNGFAPEEREAAERFINQYGFSHAGSMVNKSLKAVNARINEIIDQYTPEYRPIKIEDNGMNYYWPGRGYGYFEDSNGNAILDVDISGDVKGEIKSGRWTWRPFEREIKQEWVERTGATNAEARRNVVSNALLGNSSYDIFGVDPSEMKDIMSEYATLVEEKQKLEKLKTGFDGMFRNEAIVTRGLSKEGYQVYKDIMAQLKNAASPEARAAAQFNAVLLARHADRFAQIVRDFTGKEYTAIDYINDYVVVDAEGKNVQEGGLNQFDVRRRGILTISDFLKRVLEELNKPPKKEGTKAKGNPIRWTHDSGVIFTMEQLLHARKKHKLTDAEISDIGNNIGNLSNVRISKKQKGRFHGISYLAKIKGENGAYGVALEVSAKGEIYFKTAFNERESFYGKGEKGIDNWIKKESTEGLTGSIFNSAAASVSPTLSPTIVVQNSPNVKKNLNLFTLYQRAWHGSPYRFAKFDLGAIGSGEGRQAHGWGLYFADDREVSENYKDVLSENLGASSVPSLYEVEIPSIDEMLLEFETVTYQQDGRILEAAKKLVPEKYWDRFDDMDGRDLYRLLKKLYGGEKAASLALNSVGVKGIFYEGLRDGDCYVVFDDKAVEIIETYNQAANGQISFAGQKAIISLFETADQSTFAHETGHLFLRDLERLAAMEGVPEQVVKDYNTVKEWTSYNPKQLEEYSGTASYREFEKRHKDIQKAIREGDKALEEKLKYEWAQERWARGWEQYLREGKAPTSSLQRVFRTFKKWLNGIYRDFIQVGGAPSPDVKAVMDRMIATQDEIDLQAQRSAHASFIRSGGLNFLAEDNQELYEKYWAQAQEEAAEKVLKVAMQDVKENMAKEREELIASVREAIVEDADNNTVLTISRMVEEEPSALEVCLETAGMTREEYEAELKRLGGSYDGYIKQQLDAQVAELGNINEVEYENIKAAAEQAINNGEYCDKLYEFEIAAMVQKGAIEQRIGKMADEKFAAIEKALSGIDAKADTSKKIGMLQQRINDLRYTIRWNEAESKMLLDIQEAAAKAKLEAEKIEHKAEKAQLKHDIKEAQYNQRWREAELNLIIDGLQGKLKDKIEDFNQYRKEQREGLRVVRDAEKGWIAEARKHLINSFSTDYSIKDIGGERKRRADARSHRYDSMQLMAKGEWQAAALAKRHEVISNILADLARKAQKQMDSVETGLKKKLKTLKKNDHIAANQRYLFQILMQSFGYADKKEQYQAPTEWANANQLLMEMANAGYEMEFYDLLGQPMVERDGNNNITNINLPQWLTDAMNGKDIKPEELSMVELRDFNNFMKMLYKSGSKQMVLDKDGRKIELDAAGSAIRAQANERMAKIQEVGKGKAHQEETKRQWFSRIARWGNASILQTETVLEMMGPLAHNLVYQRITDAAMNELRDMGGTTKKLQKLMDETLGVNSKAFLEGKYRFGDEVVTGSELLAIALNCGTESNKRRVISSFNVSEEQINEALSNLTENEWKFVEGVWAMFEENWPKIAAVQISITGGMAKKEQAQAFTVKDKNGVVHEIKGGYYPIRYDSRQGTRTRQLEASNNIRAASNTAAGKNTGTGMTKERVANVSDQVLSTNLGLVSSMLAEQVHFINMRQAYLDARAVVNNKEFKNAVIEQFGTDMQAVMEEWVESQWADPRPTHAIVDTFGRWTRTSLTLGALSFRLTTAMINVANIATVSLYLGPQNAVRALRGFYKLDGNMGNRWNTVLEKSVFLAQRAEVFDANIRENVKNSIGVGKSDRVKQKIKKLMMAGFKPIMWTDMALAVPTWQYEYERVYREADPTKKTAEQIEADAIRAGDKAVRKCFGSGMKQDITSIQRGPEYTKMLTTFYSYFAVVHNLVASKVAEGRRAEHQGKGRLAKWVPIANAVLFEYIIQSLIDSAVRQFMNVLAGDEWDWEKFKKKSVTNVADNMFGAIPLLRDGVPRFLESRMGERVQDVRIPAVDLFNKFNNIANDLENDKKDKVDVLYDITKFISVTTGASDPLLNSVPTIVRFYDEYAKQNWREFLGAIILGRRLKSKE